MARTTFGGKLKHAWNAFVNQDDNRQSPSYDMGAGYGVRPDRLRLFVSNERSILSSIFMRMSVDAASVEMKHVRLDESRRYISDIDSGLNNILTVEANTDQAASMFRQDVVMSMFNEGDIAIVPINTSINPEISGGYDIQDVRVGSIVQYYPQFVRVQLYNENTGRREEVTIGKKACAIIENPFYAVMNEPNSTLQRVVRKLQLLDAIDEQSGSGKLDMLIQLPYTVRSDSRRQQADQRRKDIEFQLKGSKYGIAYIDGTEKITQLNRPAENNLMAQITYLMTMLYAQLGVTEEVMNGTADEATMLNYHNRTTEPVLRAIAEELRRKFLTKTARSQLQSVEYFYNPFKLVPMKDLAEMADKFTRNEIVTSNEFRGFIGMKPSGDPKADQLVNSNMPQAATGAAPSPTDSAAVPATDSTAAPTADSSAPPATPDEASAIVNDAFDKLNKSIDESYKSLGVDPNVPTGSE